MAAVFCAAIGATLLYQRQPDLAALTDYRPAQPLRIYTADGVEIGQFGSERRYLMPIDRIPKRMQDAVLAVEDKRFREHFGVDARGVVRAVLTNLWHSRRSQGASTITQQVARAFYLSSRKTYARKVNEMLLAVKIERQLTKDQVLELYMNQIYLGQRAYGFEAASQAYFGKTLSSLSLAETAMLAGLPQNPIHANPVANFKRARQRQLLVLDRMVDAGVATAAERDEARAEVLRIRNDRDTTMHAEHAAEMVRQIVHARFGDDAYTMGLKVTTTLRAEDQRAAYRALRKGMLDHARRQAYRGPEDSEDIPDGANAGDPAVVQLLAEYRDDEDLRVAIVTEASPQRVTATLATGEVVQVRGDGLKMAAPALAARPRGVSPIRRGAIVRLALEPAAGDAAGQWAIRQWPDVEGALVAADPSTGGLRALVGGFDFSRNQFNHATQAWRQPGSSIKPFLYSAALEHGVMPATQVNDAPLVVPPSGESPGWEPQNSDGRFDGAVTLRQALARSKNLVTIRLVKLLGPQTAREWAGRFGFDEALQPDNLTLALGSGAATPMQVATAYGVLANGGHRLEPRLVTRITDAQDKVLFEASAQELDEAHRVVPARNVFITNSLLNEVTRSGTAARAQAQLKRPDLYGKTGTTNDAVDAWFAGFQPSLVAVVWMGYDNPRSLGARESGGGLSLPVWIDFMGQALKDVPVDEPVVPDDVMNVAGDWVYIEWAFGGQVSQLGFDEPPPAPDAAASAASATP